MCLINVREKMHAIVSLFSVTGSVFNYPVTLKELINRERVLLSM